MKSEEFIKNIYNEVVIDNIKLYKDIYSEEKLKTYTMETEIIKFMKSLDNDQKTALFSLLQQTIVDSLSNIFGIIDGSSYLKNSNNIEFKLMANKKGKKYILSESLQDLFLEEDEMRKY